MADEELNTVYRILRYLVENPKAQDTLEGVVEWWLLDKYTKGNVMRVKEALEYLVSADLILQRRGKESRIYYKINPQKLREIYALLTHSSRPR
jgi:spore cortex formation protein SpoVR/YcgB (stage V sporulation)